MVDSEHNENSEGSEQKNPTDSARDYYKKRKQASKENKEPEKEEKQEQKSQEQETSSEEIESEASKEAQSQESQKESNSSEDNSEEIGSEASKSTEHSSEEKEEEKKPQRIVTKLIEDEMKTSYLDYAMSVIVGRALPDVRDGLKPVHRRILYAMHQLRMLHNKPFKKSARIVGEVLGKYHPHGDTAVYDSLVRMAQDFSLRYMLIDGQGNFGSIDGDNPAAMRYTEARLKKISEDMLQDIERETVDFIPNFDGSLKEPSVLPAKLPNLLVNGSSGIAVGMATNIPPHNIREVCSGVIDLINNPEITVQELMNSIPGPDFPTGGIICGTSGIFHAYSKGRGKIRIKARYEIEEKKDRQSIIINEIPYMVNKAELVIQIANLVKDKRVIGISDLRDESDREGMRIVIELKRDANPDIVINQLLKHSRLKVTFGIIMLALDKNEPKVLTLKQVIEKFVDHRKEVIRRKTQFDLTNAEKRAHILEGLIIALNDIDKAVKLIRASKSVEEARQSLISEFKLSEEQSQAILEMRLQKLTSLEQEKIKEEHDNLMKLIEELKSILASVQRILDIIKSELEDIKENYGDDRRTEITHEDDEDIDMEDLIDDEKMVVTVTHSGYIKRLPLDTYKQQHRGGKGIIGTETKEGDFVEHIFVASTHSQILFFTNKGKVYWIKVYKLPEGSRHSKGSAIVNLLNLEENEQITTFIPVKEFDNEHYLLMATRKGIVKKTNLIAYSKPRAGGIKAIIFDEGDDLVNVVKTSGQNEVIISTKNGQAVRFHEKDVRAVGRTSRGSRGARLKPGDEIIALVKIEENKTLFTITENGYGKRTKVSDYRLIKRGGSGVRNIICNERNGKVISVRSVVDEDELMFVSKSGIIIRIPARDITVIGRSTQGVRVMKLKDNDRVVSAASITAESLKEDEKEEPEEVIEDISKIEEKEKEEDVMDIIKETNGNGNDHEDSNGDDIEEDSSETEEEQKE